MSVHASNEVARHNDVIYVYRWSGWRGVESWHISQFNINYDTDMPGIVDIIVSSYTNNVFSSYTNSVFSSLRIEL